MAGLFIAMLSDYLNQWAPVINGALENKTSVKFELKYEASGWKWQPSV